MIDDYRDDELIDKKVVCSDTITPTQNEDKYWEYLFELAEIDGENN